MMVHTADGLLLHLLAMQHVESSSSSRCSMGHHPSRDDAQCLLWALCVEEKEGQYCQYQMILKLKTTTGKAYYLQCTTWRDKKQGDDWRPVLKAMHGVNRAVIANTPEQLIDHSFLEETFKLGIAHLKLKHPQLFSGTGASRCQIWSIGSWNKHFKLAGRRN